MLKRSVHLHRDTRQESMCTCLFCPSFMIDLGPVAPTSVNLSVYKPRLFINLELKYLSRCTTII